MRSSWAKSSCLLLLGAFLAINQSTHGSASHHQVSRAEKIVQGIHAHGERRLAEVRGKMKSWLSRNGKKGVENKVVKQEEGEKKKRSYLRGGKTQHMDKQQQQKQEVRQKKQQARQEKRMEKKKHQVVDKKKMVMDKKEVKPANRRHLQEFGDYDQGMVVLDYGYTPSQDDDLEVDEGFDTTTELAAAPEEEGQVWVMLDEEDQPESLEFLDDDDDDDADYGYYDDEEEGEELEPMTVPVVEDEYGERVLDVDSEDDDEEEEKEALAYLSSNSYDLDDNDDEDEDEEEVPLLDTMSAPEDDVEEEDEEEKALEFLSGDYQDYGEEEEA